jgi:hypothetical protein
VFRIACTETGWHLALNSFRSASSLRSQMAIWFQLTNVWVSASVDGSQDEEIVMELFRSRVGLSLAEAGPYGGKGLRPIATRP